MSANVKVARIVNYRGTGSSSGAIRLEIWKFPSPYAGGSIAAGAAQGAVELSPLAGRTMRSGLDFPQIIYNDNNRGGPNYVLFLTEHGGGSTSTNWRVVDYVNLGTRLDGTIVQAHAIGSGPADSNARPANDNYGSSAIVPSNGGVVTGSNINATKEVLEPLTYAGNRGGRSVWWLWTAPRSGIHTVSTAGSNFDTLLAVFTRTFGVVGENDDFAGIAPQSQITFSAIAGTDYRIVVDGYDGGAGAIRLTLASGATIPSGIAPSFDQASITLSMRLPQAGQPALTELFFLTANGSPEPTHTVASGSLPLGFTLSGNGTLSGTPTQAGTSSFTVRASNGSGSATQAVTVVVTAPLSPVRSRLVNLSVLTDIAQPGDEFILGYVVGGSGTLGSKPLVIRAAGPSLGAFGVAGTLGDPMFELFAGSFKTGGNDNWGGSSQLSAALTAVGAFAYTGPTSRDAATTANVTTGDNSVKVGAADRGTGKVIAEIYDATPPALFTATSPRLINVSVRKHIGTGLTMGFVLDGPTPTKILVRGIGPTLAVFGVPGTIADPRLALFNSASVKISENNDWSGTPELLAVFTAIGAFALPTTSKDAALLVTLPPGSYTVQITGANDSTGVALVEVYEIP